MSIKTDPEACSAKRSVTTILPFVEKVYVWLPDVNPWLLSRRSEATCATVKCSTSSVGTYQQWSSAHSVYFVCTDTNPAHAYVADCGANSVITASGDCTLACLREGRLPDESSPDRYYECIQTATNTFSSPIPGTCPAGTTFDASSERCVSTGSSRKCTIEQR